MALTDGIIGCWSPSIRGSGYTLPDLSGRGNHGTPTNMDAGTDWTGASVRGVSGPVLDFDGTNDYIDCGQRAGDATESIPFTVSVWGYARAFNAFAGLVSRDQSAPYAFALRVGNGVPLILTDNSSVSSASTVSTLVWIHYTAVLSSSRRMLYVDAKSVIDVAGSYTITANNDSLYIGADNVPSNTRCWNGQIGEVAIYNRALTQPEVLELYRRGNGAIGRELTGQTRRRVYGFVPAGFKAYWARRQNQIIGGGVR